MLLIHFVAWLKYLDDMQYVAANVRRYVHVGAASRWRAFLHSWCDAGIGYYLFILALAKTVTPVGVPGGSRGGPHR